MKMKKLSMAVVAASLMGSQLVMAKEGIIGDDSPSSLAFAFENSSSMQYAPLSNIEMDETEGEAAPLVILGINLLRTSSIGAATGASSYTFGWGASQLSDNPQPFSQSQFWSNTGGGAIGGLIGGPLGSRWGSDAGSFVGGIAGSSVSGYFGNNNYGNNSNSTTLNNNIQSFRPDVNTCYSCYRSGGR